MFMGVTGMPDANGGQRDLLELKLQTWVLGIEP